LSIRDLLNSNGQLLSFQEFNNKYNDCITNFLQFYQVTGTIPKYLVIKAKNIELLANEVYTRNNFLFQLDGSTQMQLDNAKTRDFYGLLNRKIHTVNQTGPMNWNSKIRLDKNAWKKFFYRPKEHLQGDKIERIPV